MSTSRDSLAGIFTRALCNHNEEIARQCADDLIRTYSANSNVVEPFMDALNQLSHSDPLRALKLATLIAQTAAPGSCLQQKAVPQWPAYVESAALEDEATALETADDVLCQEDRGTTLSWEALQEILSLAEHHARDLPAELLSSALAHAAAIAESAQAPDATLAPRLQTALSSLRHDSATRPQPR